MYVIGLTGGIASGKSTAAETLRQLGAHVIDADEISRAVTAPDGEAAPQIMARFGTLDRHQLGAIVFSDPFARRDLNAIVHPLVEKHMRAEMAASQEAVVVLDVPLLFEAGMDDMTDEVWVVYVSREEQIRRIMTRDGLTMDEAVARIESQMPTRDKVRRAHVSIDTSGPLAHTRMRIEDLWEETLTRLGETPTRCLYPASVRRQLWNQRAQQPPPARTPPGAQAAQVTGAAPFEPRMAYSPAYPPEVMMRSRRRRHQPASEKGPSVPAYMKPMVIDDKKRSAWDDTSTLMDMDVFEEKEPFWQDPRFKYVLGGVVAVVLLVIITVVGMRVIRDGQEKRAEEARIQQLADEKARYKLVYRDLIDLYSAEQDIDPAMVAAIIYNESKFDPDAVSYLGARGLMQIMEPTGEWIAERLGEEEQYTFDSLFTPETNVRYGTWYLGFLTRMFGNDVVKVAASYHAGQGAVQSWLDNPEYSANGKTLDVIPYPDTKDYVGKVETAYEMYKKHYYTPEAETAEGTEATA